MLNSESGLRQKTGIEVLEVCEERTTAKLRSLKKRHGSGVVNQ